MQNFNIILSGLTSCGKTSYGKRLASFYGMKRVSASEILLNLSQELGYHEYKSGDDKHHYRLRERANSLNQKRKQDLKLDREVDQRVLNILNSTKGIIIETLTAPFMIDNKRSNIVKIYFDVSLSTRVKRALISSDSILFKDLEIKIQEKDITSRDLIKDVWGFDIFDQEAQYQYNDIVIDNSIFDETMDQTMIENEKKQTLDLLISCITVLQKEMRGYKILESDYLKAKKMVLNSKVIKKMPIL